LNPTYFNADDAYDYLQRNLPFSVSHDCFLVNDHGSNGACTAHYRKPAFPKDNSQVTIILDASKGNKALFNYANPANVYVHIGVTTDKSINNGTQWLYVNGSTGGAWAMYRCPESKLSRQ
jgi:hypothetical protein